MGSHRPLRLRAAGKRFRVVGDRRSPEDTAKLLILNVEAYGKQRDKDCSRITLSTATIARFANSWALTSRYMDELEDCLAEYGWQLFEVFVGNTLRYAMIRLDTVEWVCISDQVLFASQGGIHKASKEHVDAVLATFGDRGYSEEEDQFEGD